MARTAVCAACLSVLAQVVIPMPSGVPMTLQTFAVALCGGVLGVKGGVCAVIVYLLMGACGLPVFAGLTGGIAKFAGPTGGFLIGFIPMAALCGVKKNALFPLMGLLSCYAIAVVFFSAVASVGIWQSVLTICAPYVIKDGVSVVLAYFLSIAIRRRIDPTKR